ncbi:MAG: voltage-gated potassium channel [Deltaproteobacteria bacterium]|nr:voltage-gated potassium channel [Deltaproteobacteria bacterium]|tara:strand:+ start:125 stop:859 length:735 start_codon:yes stop_codon:yes gene_type:complete
MEQPDSPSAASRLTVRQRLAQSLDDGPLAYLIQALILLYMVSLTLETVPSLAAYADLFEAIDITVTAIFITELVVRCVVVERPLRYLLSFYGLVDVLSILPPLIGINSKGLRLLRLLRVAKLMKNKKLSGAVRRLKLAVIEIADDLLVFTFISCLFTYFSAYLLYTFEQEAQPEVFGSIPDALWWSVVTLTTVGYGDGYPITGGGKFCAALLMLIGIGIIAIPTGLITTALASIEEQQRQERKG